MGRIYIISLRLRNSIIQSLFSSEISFLGWPRFSCIFIRIWYLHAKLWIISTFFLGLCGRWSAAFFKLRLRDCLVEKADSFCETGLVVSLDTSSDALIPDVSGVWLFYDDEAKDFWNFIRLKYFFRKGSFSRYLIYFAGFSFKFLPPPLFSNSFFLLFCLRNQFTTFFAYFCIGQATVFSTSWS